MKGNTGYENGVSELNNIGALYGHGKYATGGRNINVDDINKLTGFDPKTVSGYGSKYTVNGNEYTKTSYSYDIAEKLGSNSVTKSLLLGSNLGNDPYGAGTTYYFTNNDAERSYWLGSQHFDYDDEYGDIGWGLRYVDPNGNVTYVYLVDSNGNAGRDYLGVLPVVSLQSNIQLKPGAVVDTTNNIREWSFID